MQIPGPGGDIAVRIYRPVSDVTALPVVVYAHGGGFVFCDLDSHDGLCRNLANRIGAVFISVAYRLAPENPWPAAAEDLHAVTKWVADSAGTLGVDADRIAVGGDSAGGNLAAVTALMARDRGGPALAAQLLLYPVIAADFDTESYRLFGAGLLQPDAGAAVVLGPVRARTTPTGAPVCSSTEGRLDGLPPAVVVHRRSRSAARRGHRVRRRTRAPQGAVTRLAFEGGVHGFLTMPMLDSRSALAGTSATKLARLLSASANSLTAPYRCSGSSTQCVRPNTVTMHLLLCVHRLRTPGFDVIALINVGFAQQVPGPSP